MATASPASLAGPLATALDPSLNSSPAFVVPPTPRGDADCESPTKRQKGRSTAEGRTSALEGKGANAEGLLVDLDEAEQGLAATPSNALQPPVPSHFALSLLDKSPSLLKAHLKTPLIPLGSPVTARKSRRVPSAAQLAENASPSVRFDDRRSFSSPTPGEAPPSSPISSPSGTGPVRFSPSSPRSRRTSPRKARPPSSPSLNSETPPPVHPRLASRSSLSTPLHRVGTQPHPLATAASPFAFSPYTPPLRTHASYREDELTDCDADGSLFEGDEDVSLSYGGASLPTQAISDVDANADVEQPAQAVAPPSLTVHEEDHENSFDFPPTEPATSDEEAEPEEGGFTSSSEADEPNNGEEELHTEDEEPPRDPLETASAAAPTAEEAEDLEPTLVADSVDRQAEASSIAFDAQAGQSPEVEQPVPQVDDEQVEETPSWEPETSAALTSESEPCEPSKVCDATVEQEKPTVLPSYPATAFVVDLWDRPPSPFLSAAPTRAAELGALNTPTSPVAPSSLPSTPHCARSTQTSAPPRPVEAPRSATPSLPVAKALPSPLPSTSAATPATRTTPSAVKRVVVPPTAAPTAHRQLTKLSSLAAQRTAAVGSAPPSSSASKPALTSLIPGSAAIGSRRLIASGKPALAKPSGLPSSIARKPATLGSVKELPAGKEAPQVEQDQKRPGSALSSCSSSSTAAPAQSTIPRPRTVPRSGLKAPTASTTPAGAAVRSALPALSTSSRLAASTTKATSVPALRPTRAAAAATRPTLASSRPARTTSALETTSLRPPAAATLARSPSALTQTSSAPALGSARAPSPSLPLPARSARVPRAALAASSAAAVPQGAPKPASLPLPLPLPAASSSSPVKRRAARLVGGKVELPKSTTHPPADVPPSPAAPQDAPPSPRSATPDAAILAAAPSTVFAPVSPKHCLASPPRVARPPVSPTRSPRRVLVSTQQTVVSPPVAAASALSAPAEKLAVSTAAPEVFGVPVPSKLAPVRATRSRRTRSAMTEPVPAVPARITRRAAAAVAAPPPPPAPLQRVEPVVRSARNRGTLRKAPTPEASLEEPSASEDSLSTVSSDDAVPATRAYPVFRPVPTLSDKQYLALLKRNTTANQKPFNKLKVEVVYLDYERPPSPTSKIRRSVGEEGSVGRPSTKEGREARAAKRRNALRSSTDGSEFEVMAAELQAEAAAAVESGSAPGPQPLEHFRAPGDEEQYVTPMRAPPLRSIAAKGGKKKVSTGSVASASPAKEPKRIRWDKALVYDGPRPDVAQATDKGIIKLSELNEWGNAHTSPPNFGKAVPVLISRRLFKGEEEE
ncbi:hypothetical protein JCM10213_002561 [Rhodosporidiobolus nylandii]